MAKAVKPKRQDPRAEQEFRTLRGKNSGTRYLIIRTRRRRKDHFNVYAECEVTRACQDIVGDSEKRLRLDQLIDKAWGY